MNIPYQSILNYITNSSNQYWIYFSNIDSNDISVLLLCLLYHNEIITKKQLCLYLNRYKDGHLSRKLNNYHSKINDKWYTDTSFTNVLLDIANSCKNKDVTLDQLLGYLNIGFNKNKNWCINWLAFSIIDPIIYHNNKNESMPLLKEFGFNLSYVTFEEAKFKYDLGYGHCCDDCSGDYDEYIKMQYEYYYITPIDKIKEEVKTQLLKLKTHNRNLTDKLLSF